jgi:hypothetical protein
VNPWIQLCARAAPRGVENCTVENRSVPAGTGTGLVMSDIFPKGYSTVIRLELIAMHINAPS